MLDSYKNSMNITFLIENTPELLAQKYINIIPDYENN